MGDEFNFSYIGQSLRMHCTFVLLQDLLLVAILTNYVHTTCTFTSPEPMQTKPGYRLYKTSVSDLQAVLIYRITIHAGLCANVRGDSNVTIRNVKKGIEEERAHERARLLQKCKTKVKRDI